MIGIPLRYLLKNPADLRGMLSDPVQLWTNVVDGYVAQKELRRPQCPYKWDKDWDQRLHEYLEAPWPCAIQDEFAGLYPEVMKELEAKGIRPGPMSFGSWNDGDYGLARAIYCITRHLKPANVVETGVAHGVTSRLILEAMERNGVGHLWSIDLPPIEKDLRVQVAVAVSDRFANRWNYIKGPSRLRLPELLSQIGTVDFFVHDSLHTERNVRFEMDSVWPRLKPGGVIVVDDVDANWGYLSFTQKFTGLRSLICEAEPIHPDERRFNQKGLFGIIVKDK
jgi:hypothetical protein